MHYLHSSQIRNSDPLAHPGKDRNSKSGGSARSTTSNVQTTSPAKRSKKKKNSVKLRAEAAAAQMHLHVIAPLKAPPMQWVPITVETVIHPSHEQTLLNVREASTLLKLLVY